MMSSLLWQVQCTKATLWWWSTNAAFCVCKYCNDISVAFWRTLMSLSLKSNYLFIFVRTLPHSVFGYAQEGRRALKYEQLTPYWQASVTLGKRILLSVQRKILSIVLGLTRIRREFWTETGVTDVLLFISMLLHKLPTVQLQEPLNPHFDRQPHYPLYLFTAQMIPNKLLLIWEN